MESKVSRRKRSDVKYPAVNNKLTLQFLKTDDVGYQISVMFCTQSDSLKRMLLTIFI